MKSIQSLTAASFLVLLMYSLAPATAFSQTNQNPPKVSREQKIQMLEQSAKAHQAAADCLKSGRAESECRDVMKKNMPQMGEMGCPMMGDHPMNMQKNMNGPMDHSTD